MTRLPRLSLVVVVAAALLLVFAAGLSVQARAAAPLAPNAVTPVQYAEGLSSPVDIANTGLPGDERLFVVERRGRIKILPPGGGNVVAATPFLSITDRVTDEGGEQGLLGLAFSPNYANDHHFFVYYVNTAGNLQLSRFSVGPDPDVALPAETPLLLIPHPTYVNHNGGDLAFGPDGYLYLAPGDGGGGNSSENGQSLTTLLGKVLRLDVTGEITYSVPITNPFYGPTTGRDEIWAYGLRNPFRFSFDRLTGDLYIGDVGQGEWEEINFQPAASTGGENYGWRCYEGHAEFNLSGCAVPGDYVFPVAEYCNDRADGCTNGGQAVIAGNVYRGTEYPDLSGVFFYADNASGRFWSMQPGSPWTVTPLGTLGVATPSSFGEDIHGEIYVTSLTSGRVYHLQGDTPFVLQTPYYLPMLRR